MSVSDQPPPHPQLSGLPGFALRPPRRRVAFTRVAIPSWKTRAGPLADLVRQNATKPCDVPSCTNKRHPGSGSRWCTGHRKKVMRYGHPDGQFIPLSSFKRIERTVRLILTNPANANRTVLREALVAAEGRLAAARGAFQRYIDGGRQPSKMHRVMWHRLVCRKITAVDLVIRVVAVLIYLARNPDVVPDQRAGDFFIATALLQSKRAGTSLSSERGVGGAASSSYDDLTESDTEPSAPIKAELGEWARVQMATLFAHAMIAVEAADKRREELAKKRAESAPFDIGPRAPTGRTRSTSTT